MNGCNLKICGIIMVVLARFKKEFKKMKQKRKNCIAFRNKTPQPLVLFFFLEVLIIINIQTTDNKPITTFAALTSVQGHKYL